MSIAGGSVLVWQIAAGILLAALTIRMIKDDAEDKVSRWSTRAGGLLAGAGIVWTALHS